MVRISSDQFATEKSAPARPNNPAKPSGSYGWLLFKIEHAMRSCLGWTCHSAAAQLQFGELAKPLLRCRSSAQNGCRALHVLVYKGGTGTEFMARVKGLKEKPRTVHDSLS